MLKIEGRSFFDDGTLHAFFGYNTSRHILKTSCISFEQYITSEVGVII